MKKLVLAFAVIAAMSMVSCAPTENKDANAEQAEQPATEQVDPAATEAPATEQAPAENAEVKEGEQAPEAAATEAPATEEKKAEEPAK
ncbi:MAG: hypothetical protein IJS04_05720 [Muribaculaceae bacterium]|nr:hypothetical protein [Muribaculaceae bacterium]